MQQILILDENAVRQAGLCRVLGERGCGTVLAGGQAQALAVLACGMVDAVILPQSAMPLVAGAARQVPLICLSQCDEAGVGEVFALSPMVFAVMDPDTPPAVVADLVQAAMRDTSQPPVPAPKREAVQRGRLTLA